jgi:DNA-directed RNA polymerase subunit RPC12/RpoP
MTWRCAECGDPETGKNQIDVVCHHCGKPLCKEDRTSSDGDVFSEVDRPIRNRAYHCHDCYQTHHVTASFPGHQG